MFVKTQRVSFVALIELVSELLKFSGFTLCGTYLHDVSFSFLSYIFFYCSIWMRSLENFKEP